MVVDTVYPERSVPIQAAAIVLLPLGQDPREEKGRRTPCFSERMVFCDKSSWGQGKHVQNLLGSEALAKLFSAA